jgi:hypothetical protein
MKVFSQNYKNDSARELQKGKRVGFSEIQSTVKGTKVSQRALSN